MDEFASLFPANLHVTKLVVQKMKRLNNYLLKKCRIYKMGYFTHSILRSVINYFLIGYFVVVNCIKSFFACASCFLS